MSKLTTWTICVALSAALVQPVIAADNELTPEEKAAGWQLLFNGNDYNGWRCNNGRKIASKIEDHCLVPHKSGGYLIIYEKEFGDFVLTCDVKMDPVCNSGVFVRVGNPKDPVQTGFEVQVASEIGTGKHDFGSLVRSRRPEKGPPPFTRVEHDHGHLQGAAHHGRRQWGNRRRAELRRMDDARPLSRWKQKQVLPRDQGLSAERLHRLSGPRAQGVVQERQDSRVGREVKAAGTREPMREDGPPVHRRRMNAYFTGGLDFGGFEGAAARIAGGRPSDAGPFLPVGFFARRLRAGRPGTVRLGAGFLAGDLGRRVVGRFDGIDFFAGVQVGRRMADDEVFRAQPG